MLDYSKISDLSTDEVIDPVSGDSFPMSVNDMHAERAQVKQDRQDAELASMLSSIMK